ncbi:hypothetical protein L6452_11950 [Arctium lappa]|uniref:Uncharacterized protein n=1 Tax=Arctium lappa TaxID=4217 RepID=A0ACB9DR70_ARCLA|nr:hypothetical protein L6452_11950 [Arctium lappa]
MDLASYSASSSIVSLKLLVNKKAQKVLFAEANKEFVDFLFNILSLPVGTVINLLTEHPMCKGRMSYILSYVTGDGAAKLAGEGGGFVKGVVTYMVMDDLEVKPMSTISSITMFNMFNVKKIGDLEEKVVSLGMKEGLMLLKASFECKNVLTTVFLA